jgi:Mannosyltransferase (PIG-V)
VAIETVPASEDGFTESPVASPKPSLLFRPVAVFAAARVVNLVVFSAATALAAGYGEQLDGRPWPVVLQTKSLFARALFGWDASWYLFIARHGYASHGRLDSGMAFFPGYPLTIRLVGRVTGLSLPLVALALAFAFGAAAAVAVWLLSRQLGGTAFADRSVALFSFFPGAFVFSMAYAEPMMVAASAACLLCLLRRRWVAAGLCGALATVTRPNAVVLVVCCGVAAVAAVRRSSEWKALWAPALTAAGTASYCAFLWHRTGRLLAWLDVQRGIWHERISPLASLRKAAGLMHGFDLNDLVPTLGLIVAVAGIVLLLRWKPPPVLVVYAVGVVVLAAAAGNLGVRPRFVTTAFPLAQAFAWRLQGVSFAVLLAVCAALMATLTFLVAVTLLLIP